MPMSYHPAALTVVQELNRDTACIGMLLIGVIVVLFMVCREIRGLKQ